MTGPLQWVALSAEDAPEFLTSAPVTRGELERRKIEAIALPIGLLLAAPIDGLAFASPWAAICTTLFALGAGVSTALVNLWLQAPARRVTVLRRHSQSRLAALIELLSRCYEPSHARSRSWAVGQRSRRWPLPRLPFGSAGRAGGGGRHGKPNNLRLSAFSGAWITWSELTSEI